MSEAQCLGTNKAGEPCKAPTVFGGPYCLAHAPRDVRDSVGFGGPQAGAGRPALPKPTDIARQLIEQHVHSVLRPHFLTLGMDLADDGTITRTTGATMVGESKDGTMVPSDIEDLGAQIAAAEKLLDRVYGRPKQVSEVSGPEGGPVQLSAPLDDRARSAQAAGLLKDLGEVSDDA